MQCRLPQTTDPYQWGYQAQLGAEDGNGEVLDTEREDTRPLASWPLTVAASKLSVLSHSTISTQWQCLTKDMMAQRPPAAKKWTLRVLLLLSHASIGTWLLSCCLPVSIVLVRGSQFWLETFNAAQWAICVTAINETSGKSAAYNGSDCNCTVAQEPGGVTLSLPAFHMFLFLICARSCWYPGWNINLLRQDIGWPSCQQCRFDGFGVGCTLAVGNLELEMKCVPCTIIW